MKPIQVIQRYFTQRGFKHEYTPTTAPLYPRSAIEKVRLAEDG